jgi:uncharacterized protein (DUF433 family)
MNEMQLAPRIVATADTCSGHPRVEGTRVRVSHVIGWLAAGMTPDEVVRDYPYLTLDDVKACLDYAARTLDAQPVPAK